MMEYEIDEITEIQYMGVKDEQFYDVGMVDTPHMFFANDILVHNSMYLNLNTILESIGVIDLKKYDDEQIKNFIMFSKFLKNSEVYDATEKKGKIILDLKPKFKEMSSKCNSLQNLISSLVTQSMDTLTVKSFNCSNNKIFFKREAISRRVAFLQKKRYAMWVLNNEGVETNKVKCVGLEIVRSSTPLMIQSVLEDIVLTMLKTVDYPSIEKKIREFKLEFMKASPEKIAFPRGIHKLDEYTESVKAGVKKSVPIHVRAAILYNDKILANRKLKSQYEVIHTDSKMKFLYIKPTAAYTENVIGFVDVLPKEFSLEGHIDKELQFDKTFINPLTAVFAAFGWTFPNLINEDISDLFVY